jgi:flavin-dependent dehydrogenase
MSTARFAELNQSFFDVVICGGGLAGLTLARQLRRTHPSLSVLLAEKTARPLPEAAHKVGESSVELGSQYLERLGLVDYLRERHLFKHGLRFFPGGGELPLEARAEIGPAQEPIVPSYQLDRGRFENDLRDMIVAEDGVTLVEGATVGEIAIGEKETPHEVELARGDEKVRIRCRWVVDATGRNALLRRRMKLTRGSRHDANAGWYRVEGKVDITDFVPESVREWHDAAWAPHRWRSTNHLMGAGYWAWIIPLASGNTSIGLVVHDAVHGFDAVRGLDRVQAFLEAHEPVMARALADRKVLDFRCLRGYSHNVSRAWSPDRWAIVGEAGAFVDPLYSPGTDYIAFANSFTEEMIRADLAGGDLATRATELNLVYRALVNGNIDLYRDAAPIYGHAEAMLAKVYWDNFAYWSYPCQFFLQEIYRLSGPALDPVMPIGQRFVELSNYAQKLLGAWAVLAPEAKPQPGFRGMPGFPSVLVDAHLALQQRMSPHETFAYMRSRLAEGEEILGELLVHVLDAVGEARVDALVEAAGVARWELRVDDARIEAMDALGLARRKALRPLARDVERTLGKQAGQVSKATMRRVLAPLLVRAPAPAAETAS